jgi:hypothetical protein
MARKGVPALRRVTQLRIAGVHAERLRQHLFPGDGKEAVAFAVCGRHQGPTTDVLVVRDLFPVPYSDCPVREEARVNWRTQAIEPALLAAEREKLGVVKFHSHPTGYGRFSPVDDASDADLFPSVYGWVDDDGPHASVVMLPDGKFFGRAIDLENRFSELERILVVGDDISVHLGGAVGTAPSHAQRHEQLFGAATTHLLRSLTVAVVGCSGTGSFVIEMLTRLGVRRLILVDPDLVEYRNLNRIVGATSADAALGRPKVEVLAESVARIGLGTEVVPFHGALMSREAVLAVASCDLLVGCMDSHDGRRTLNRLATFYILPYFDCGVGLDADGNGGIEKVVAASHYLQPGASSLLARRVVNQKKADAEAWARKDPAAYAELRRQKYIDGVEEDRPAVISVNALAASLVVNEMLARLHPYRADPNKRFASVRLAFSDMHLDVEPESGTGEIKRALGRGDVRPLLDMSDLSVEV